VYIDNNIQKYRKTIHPLKRKALSQTIPRSRSLALRKSIIHKYRLDIIFRISLLEQVCFPLNLDIIDPGREGRMHRRQAPDIVEGRATVRGR
jgi:hypothetical protein